jgi:hypothetical protein
MMQECLLHTLHAGSAAQHAASQCGQMLLLVLLVKLAGQLLRLRPWLLPPPLARTLLIPSLLLQVAATQLTLSLGQRLMSQPPLELLLHLAFLLLHQLMAADQRALLL